MGKLIIQYNSKNRYEVESLNCKSETRAHEIVAKRNNVQKWDFYPTGKRIPNFKTIKKEDKPLTFEQMEAMLRNSSSW